MPKILHGISYDGGPGGQAFGGGIYNLSASFGGSTGPTTINMNVVSENGEYTIDDTALNVSPTGSKTIKVGSVTFYNMFIYKYGFSQGPGRRTLNVSFKDASIFLDKIYVGLNARSAPAVVGGQQTFGFSLSCVECNSLTPTISQKTGQAKRTPFVSAVSSTVGHPMAGGFLLVGKEKWSESPCAIPQVDYSFQELLAEIAKINPPIGNNLASFIPPQGSSHRQNYTGSLRDVLNNWASDFNFEFYCDPFSPWITIKGVDLGAPSTSLDALKAAVNNGFNSSNGALLRNYDETRSLDNTVKRTNIVKSLKAGRTFTRNQVAFEKVTVKPLKITDAIGYTAHLGRTDDEMYTSVALAKYQTEVRNIWLSATIAAKGNTGSGWPSLGFIPEKTNGEVTDGETKRQILRLLGQMGIGDNQTWSHPIYKDPNNYHIFLGVYNEEYQAAVEQFDSELADFVGKYGYFDKGGATNPPQDYRSCDHTDNDHFPVGVDPKRFFSLDSKITTLPNGQLYKGRSYPFESILRANNGNIALSTSEVYIVPLEDNAWGTHESHIHNMFENEYIVNEQTGGTQWANPDGTAPIPQTDLNNYIPVFARLTTGIYDIPGFGALRQLFPNFDDDYIAQDKRVKGYFPGVAVIPKLSALTVSDPLTGQSKELFHVSNGPNQANGQVFDNRRRRVAQMAGAAKKECQLYCDEEIVNQVCGCDDIEDPIHHFPDVTARSILVRSYSGNPRYIIFPVESDYTGFWKAEMTFKGTYPKDISIAGTPPPPDGTLWGANFLNVEVKEHNVTSEVDPHLDQSKMNQRFVIPGSSSPITLSAYYALLNQVNGTVTSQNLGGAAPTQKVRLTIDSTDYDTVSSFINPQFGLLSLNFNLDGEGLVTELEFQNRHPKPPKKDTLIQELGPRLLDGQMGYSQPVNYNNPSGLNLPKIPWR